MNLQKIYSVVIIVAVGGALAFALSGVYVAMQPDLADREKVEAWAHQTYGEEQVDSIVIDNHGGAVAVLKNGTWVEYPGDANVELKVSGEVMG